LEGVFAGYYIQPGYTWSKQYLVWPLTDFDGLKLLVSTPADEFPLREPHKVGRLVVPPGSWRFPLKARYDFVHAELEGDCRRRERCSDPLSCPPDAPPVGQETLLSEAPNFAVENIPRFDEELEAAADDDDLFGLIVDEGAPKTPAPPDHSASGKEGGDPGEEKSAPPPVPPPMPPPPDASADAGGHYGKPRYKGKEGEIFIDAAGKRWRSYTYRGTRWTNPGLASWAAQSARRIRRLKSGPR
jgi:hypothetical protein